MWNEAIGTKKHFTSETAGYAAREEKEGYDINDLLYFVNQELTAQSCQKRGNNSKKAKVPGDGGKRETGKTPIAVEKA